MLLFFNGLAKKQVVELLLESGMPSPLGAGKELQEATNVCGAKIRQNTAYSKWWFMAVRVIRKMLPWLPMKNYFLETSAICV